MKKSINVDFIGHKFELSKVNSRTRRKFGNLSYAEVINKLEDLKKAYKDNKGEKVHCSWEDYHPTDLKQINFIKQAQHMYVVGKHAGSKPIGRILSRINAMNRQVSRYSKFIELMEAKNKQNEEVKVENVD